MKMDNSRGMAQPVLPTRNLSIPVDKEQVRKSAWINADDSILSEVKFTIPDERAALSRSDMTILSVVATNKWKRPICFTSPYGKFGWGAYFRKNGLVYQLTPVQNNFNLSAWELENSMRAGRLWGSGVGNMNLPFTYEALTKRFQLGGAHQPGVYYDEENRRHLLHIRAIYAEAAGNLADAGKMEEAKKLLDIIDKDMIESNMPYAMTSRDNQHNQTGLLTLEAAYKAKKMDLAERIGKALRTDLTQQKAYQSYNQQFTGNVVEFDRDGIINEVMLMALDRIESKYKVSATTPAPPPTPQTP